MDGTQRRVDLTKRQQRVDKGKTERSRFGDKQKRRIDSIRNGYRRYGGGGKERLRARLCGGRLGPVVCICVCMHVCGFPLCDMNRELVNARACRNIMRHRATLIVVSYRRQPREIGLSCWPMYRTPVLVRFSRPRGSWMIHATPPSTSRRS